MKNLILITIRKIVGIVTYIYSKVISFFKSKFGGKSKIAIGIFLLLNIIDIYFSIQLGFHIYHKIHEHSFLVQEGSVKVLSEMFFMLTQFDSETINYFKQVSQKMVSKRISLSTMLHKVPKSMLIIYTLLSMGSFVVLGRIPLGVLAHEAYYIGREFIIQFLAHKGDVDTIEKVIEKIKDFTNNLFKNKHHEK